MEVVLEYEDLIGTWKFNSVWKKGSEEIDNISSSFFKYYQQN